jgi:hypothetical protein
VTLSLEQQARIMEFATKDGTDPERLVANVIARYIDQEARFLAAVENGIATGFEEEMDARLETMFKR